MTEFMLTNRQREYFGLQSIEPEWDQIPLGDLQLFFDGNVIRKVICYEYNSQYGYCEYDYDIRTQSRKQLLPGTARGKPKPLTPGNILARKSLGFSFACHFGWRGKAFAFQHLCVMHCATGDILKSVNNHGMNSFDQLASWVEAFIDACPPDHLERIDKLRNTRHVRIRYQPGDIFAIPFSDDCGGYGRILLDIFRLRKTGLFRPVPCCGLDSPILGSGLLVVLYRYAGIPVAPEAVAELPILGTLLTMHDDLYRGRFPIIGHVAVTENELDFPEGILPFQLDGDNVQHYFQKGGMSVAVDLSNEEFGDAPKLGCAFRLKPERILDAVRGDETAQHSILHDVRFWKRRPEILRRCGLDPAMTYTQMVAKKGGITPSEFLAAAQDKSTLRKKTRSAKPKKKK